MPILPAQVDPTIQAALKDRLTQIFSSTAALDPSMSRVRSAGMQRWRENARKHRAYFWAAGAAFAGAFLGAPILAHLGGDAPAVLTMFTMIGVSVASLVRGLVKAQGEATAQVSPELMRGAGSLVALSRAEQLYCEALAALVDAEPVLGEKVQQEMLQQLNGLLESHRKLSGPMQQYLAAAARSSLEEMERERQELTRRRDALADPGARELMEQSLNLCSRRLEYARALQPAREKAEAQQELILQTMASVQAGLARSLAAPATAMGAEVAQLQESVTVTNRQARAVEEAVAEVMSLGG